MSCSALPWEIDSRLVVPTAARSKPREVSLHGLVHQTLLGPQSHSRQTNEIARATQQRTELCIKLAIIWEEARFWVVKPVDWEKNVTYAAEKWFEPWLQPHR